MVSVTLADPVDQRDAFGLLRSIEPCPPTCVADPVVELCSPPRDAFPNPLCEPGTHELTFTAEIGSVLTYALYRWPDDASPPEKLLPGSVLFQRGTLHVRLTYRCPSVGSIPNTAMPAD